MRVDREMAAEKLEIYSGIGPNSANIVSDRDFVTVDNCTIQRWSHLCAGALAEDLFFCA